MLESVVFGISTADSPTWLTVAALLATVTIAASFLPAWRETQENPVKALRTE